MAKMNKTKIGVEGQSQTSGPPVQEEGSSLELPELFCSLGSLIVEGRLPGAGQGRGYYEGPHVELPGKISRHQCSQNEYLCNKNENFRKHMLLLWQNNVPMAIEILLCSDCRVGRAKARSLEVTTVPEPGSILLEQWTVSVAGAGQGAGTMTGAQLLQAVRSYLHFSQLSAWYSKTQGTRPWNVLIRVTIPGQEFATKFTRPPEQHYFPAAGGAGAGNISVSVRSLPRTDDIPTVVCAHTSPAASSPDSEEAEDTKLGIAGALAWRERDQGDLRRSLVKAKLVTAEAGDCPGPGRLTKSDSMDSMLGDSLLDPPPSLAKMPPKRYQSPSRCGSPSLEAPEPLMSGYRALYEAAPPPAYDQAMAMRGAAAGDPEADSMEARLNRHDLLRRRDLTLFHGLHPRLFHPGHLHQPRLSLPPKQPAAPALPCRAVAQPPSSPGSAAPPGPVVTDRLPLRCTIAGKHICQFEEEVQEEAASPASPGSTSEAAGSSSSPPPALSPASPSPPGAGCRYRQEELGAKAKGWSGRVVRTATPYSRDSSSDSSQAERRHGHAYTPHRDADCHGEIEDVLNYLKTRNSPISSSKERMDPVSKDEFLCCKTSRRPSLEEIFDKQNLKPSSSVTQVYRTEINCNNNIQVNQKPDRTNLLLEAILRPQKTESGGSKAAPEIHSLRETSKYCTESGDSGSESAASPLSPDCDQLLLPWTREHRGRGDEETNSNNNNNNNSNLTDGVDIKPGCEAPLWPTPPLPLPDLGLGDLCQDLQTKCLITKKDIGVQENSSLSTVADSSVRIRSFSETCGRHPDVTARLQDRRGAGPALQPLDFTFEEYDESWSVLDDSCESLNNNNGSCGIVGDKRRKSIEDDDGVPSANKKNAFRKSFDSAASMVFQRRTGLPLTSSPAPMRRGIKFDFDSGINTPKDIKRALFEAQSPEESECGSPKKKKRDPRRLLSTSAPATISSNNLLCNFEESVLNGRLEPVSTVEGFTAEIGASGSFQPKHLSFPVTVFFYTLCENSNYASPYLGHINLGKKGYRIPDRGTIQLTLFNPLGTVVKMFVVMYNLTDMPPNSQTFLRQRTLYMPADKTDSDPDAQKWLRYLIHLRVASSKSGRLYLHTDVRMIIFRKSDLDTATDHEAGKGWELRSFTRGPTNPKFSPRK